jgi:hypothetical protein
LKSAPILKLTSGVAAQRQGARKQQPRIMFERPIFGHCMIGVLLQLEVCGDFFRDSSSV